MKANFLLISAFVIFATPVAAQQIASIAEPGDVIAIEQDSPGVTPSTHFHYVELFSSDLRPKSILLQFPFLGGTPTALAFVDNDLVLAEWTVSNGVSQQRLVRHPDGGLPKVLGDTIQPTVHAIRQTTRGDLIIVTDHEILRMNPTTETIESRIDTVFQMSILAADVDVDGCRIAIVADEHHLALIDICVTGVGLREGQSVHLTNTNESFRAVQFSPAGNVLVLSYVAPDSSGKAQMLIREAGFDGATPTLHILQEEPLVCNRGYALGVDRGANRAFAGCFTRLMGIDLGTWSVISEGSLRFIDPVAIDVRGSAAPARRRSVRR